ncbi:hypothetical protein [Mariniblastus fucicola]|uniref:Carboxypeptidase regulatory-like domain-containing protein n=1 Tax=Mariniblastus fucicola TaxID=980251 RepID=A0A5B9PGP8_9BACT|nr:hypothetical protein [Mariniblastus fucicola]QEG24405.1 hypothetical protein MFFC18_43240 [Mariniblastus fucicola]
MLASKPIGQPTLGVAMIGLLLGVSCFTLALCSGCKEPLPEKVTGSVTYKGKPVFPAKVMLKPASGNGLSANLTNDGQFTVHGIEPGKTYDVAIEGIKLKGIANAKPSKTGSGSEQPKRREDKVPEKFQQANIAFPKKYASFDTSGLTIDCSNGLPNSPVVLELN